MSLLQFLQLQPVEPNDDTSDLDYCEEDEISLTDTIDASELNHFLSDAVDEMHADPLWQSLSRDDDE